MKECNRKAINTYYFLRKYKKWKIYFGHFVDKGHKMQTSFERLASKNAATRRLHQTCGKHQIYIKIMSSGYHMD